MPKRNYQPLQSLQPSGLKSVRCSLNANSIQPISILSPNRSNSPISCKISALNLQSSENPPVITKYPDTSLNLWIMQTDLDLSLIIKRWASFKWKRKRLCRLLQVLTINLLLNKTPNAHIRNLNQPFHN